MNLNKIKRIMFYLPCVNKDYRITSWNVIIFKIKYEKHNYIAIYDMFDVHYSFSKL